MANRAVESDDESMGFSPRATAAYPTARSLAAASPADADGTMGFQDGAPPGSSRTRSRSQPGSRSPQAPSYFRPQPADMDHPSTSSRPRKYNTSRFHDDVDEDVEGNDGWDGSPREYERHTRDSSRVRRPGSRRGAHSRPPPTMLNPVQANYHQGVNWAEEEYDEKAKQPRHHGARVTRSSFDSAVKHRPSDEEMGFGSDRVLHRLYSAPHHDDGHRGRRLEWQNLSAKEKAEVLRLPLTDWMNSSVKNHFVAAMGELVGTTMFLFFAFAGTEVANIRADTGDQTTTGGATGFNVAVLLYVSLSFGFSLMVNVWVFFRISGGLFNPAVTFGMVLVRAISVVRAVCLFFAQMCGSLLASVMVRYLFPETFNVRTTLGGGATIVQGVFIEAILTAELVFTIFMLAKEKHRATFIAPVGIGLALFIAELVGVQFTGGSLNPARSFGPCVITATFDSEHWIYWVGPTVGSLIAVVFYRFIKTLEYEMANPGADGDPSNDPTQNPEKREEVLRSSRSPSMPN
ncbi:hypothetical protein S40285_04846 [Stachybotrys chlorohalonatus IBT 40285]|uniref:Aquaporin n=1 Tax=Stachybotrys chlorohalonatus (strain IBT 40285) TaxID=1283841 RepID=A0A084QA89_STAC4|nr:hypothetical protein S40285_04846 [Stachybotrys chlorohalonata IBT 40285]